MSDQIIVTSLTGSIVEALQAPDTIVLTADAAGNLLVINDANDVAILQVESPSTLMIEPEVVPRVEVLTAGTQGPAGRDGAAGDVAVMPASGSISGHRVMAPTGDGRVRYASCDNPADANAVLGISLGAAADGDNVTVQQGGVITEPSWAWVPNLPIFCGLNGLLTQEPPTAGFAVIVAIATTVTSAAVGIKQPIIIS